MKELNNRSSLKFIIYFFIPVLFAIPFTTMGQNVADYNKIDSLVYQLKESKPDSNRVKLLNELSTGYLSKLEISSADLKETFKHLRNAIALCDSLRLPFAKWKATCISLFGNALIRCDSVAEGRNVFMGLVKDAHDAGDKKREAESWRDYALALSAANKINDETEAAYVNALTIYRDIKDLRGDAHMSICLAHLHYYYHNFNLAETEFLNVIKKCEILGAFNLPVVYYHLAIINRYTGNYNKALGYALHAIKAMEDEKSSSNADIYYGEIAEIYEALDKPAESVIWYKKCISKRELQAGYSSYFLYRTYSLLIGQLIRSGEQMEALEILKNLRKRRPPNTLRDSAVLFQSMAYCYDAYSLYDSTEKYLLKTIDVYNQMYKQIVPDNEIVLLSYYEIADFYVKHQQFKKARPYVNTIASKLHDLKASKVADVQLLLFKEDSASGNYITAIKHLQQYKTLTDSIFNERKSRQIEQLQVEYKTEKKDQEINLLTKKDQLQQANLKQATIIRNWITVSAALLILLLAVGYNRYRFKQKANKKLEAQQIVINQKNISLQRLVNEKEWLMKEIHHRVKNNFHIVMGLLGTQSGYLKNEEAIAAIKESQQRIHAMSLIHQKLYQSENLSAIDMPAYIHELADYLKESFDKGTSIRFHFQVHRIQLALSHVIPVGLILNEAITNAFKYAFPGNKEGNIYISFIQAPDDNRILLTVKDDGAGLPAGFNSNSHSSMGLNLMKGLSEDIDGSFAIRSDNGTIVTMSFIYKPDLLNDFAPSASSQNISV